MKYYLFLFLILYYSIGAAQTGVLEGKVIDSTTNEPLIGVNVTLTSLSEAPSNSLREQFYDILGTATNFSGEFIVKNLKNGNYEATISYIGYQKIKSIITIPENGKTIETFYMQKSSTEMDVVVISAGKFEQKLEEVTVSMDIIKPTLIENKNTVDLSELMNQSPGVQIIDGQANIRGGSGWSYNTGSRVLVMVDDMPLLSGDRGTVEWDMIPMENISQIEVIKGASSVLFGSSALNGVINVRTAYPKGDPETRFSAFSGYYDAPSRDALHWWKKEDPRLFSGASFSYAQYKNNTGLIIGGNIYTNKGYKGGYVFDPVADVDESGDPVDDDPGNTEQDKAHPDFGKEIPVSEKWARFNFKTEHNSVKFPGLSYGISGNFMLLKKYESLIFAHDTIGYTPIGVPQGDEPLLFDQWMYNIDPHIKYINPNNNTKHSYKSRFFKDDYRPYEEAEGYSTVLYQEYQFQKTFDMKHGHIVSTSGVTSNNIEGNYDAVYGDGGLLSTLANLDSDLLSQKTNIKEMHNYSLYSQFDFKYKSVNLSLGARFEKLFFQEKSYDIPVVRGGVNVRILPTTYMRGSFGQGYRFPTIMESFVKTDYHPMYIYPGTSEENTLRPEYGWSAEVGVKQLLKIGEWKGMLDIAGFKMYYNDMIEFTFGRWGTSSSEDDFYGIGFKCVNIGETEISGIEGSLIGEGQIGNIDVSLMAGYTYSRPIILDPDNVYYEAVSSLNGTITPLNYGTYDDNEYLLDEQGNETTDENPNYNPTGASYDNSNQILKYRHQHVAKFDAGFKYKNYSTGLSVRYKSVMQNMDAIFAYGFFNKEGAVNELPALEDLGLVNSWERYQQGAWIFDWRIGLDILENLNLSLIIDNILNEEHINRPADLAAPRTITFKLSGKI